MELNIGNEQGLAKLDILGEPAADKGKSTLRERYEGEVAQIKSRFGSLEQMRARLGLTKRRMAEYLLVDPSAWTRWTTEEGGESAPLHVYKTMSYLMSQYEKAPQGFQPSTPLDAEALKRFEFEWRREVRESQGQLQVQLQTHTEQALEDIKSQLRQDFARQVDELKKSVANREELSLGWKLLLIINAIAVVYLILF